jgi:acyl carrier protein
VRPSDTGRSTNCLINDAGIWVHKKERGFHNYALPYSWDVRLGHKQREAALAELDDEIDEEHVRRTLSEIGYDPQHLGGGDDPAALEAFYVGRGDVPHEDLRRQLGERLPAPLVPLRLHRIDALPLTTSGKVDEAALAREALTPHAEVAYRPPRGPVEEFLAGVWQEELGVERVGANDDFFELGGTSLTAMQVMVRLCREYDIDLPLETPFSHSRLEGLARVAEDRILADAEGLPPRGEGEDARPR